MSLFAKQWAVRNVARATFKDISTGDVLCYLDNLQTSKIDVSSQTVYARGGDGNPKLVGFSSDKEVKVELASAIFDNRAMALLTGNDIVTGAGTAFRREVATVSGGTATLLKTPKNGTLHDLYIIGTDGVESTQLVDGVPATETGEYTLATKTIDVHDSIADGTQLAAYFDVTTDAESQTITVSSDSFPQGFQLILDVFVTSFYDKKLYKASVNCPSVKMEDSWSLSFSASGDPQVLNLPMEVLKPSTSSDMFTLHIFNEDDVA